MSRDDGVKVRLGAQGRVVLPRAFLDRLGVEVGGELVATYEGGRVVLAPPGEDLVDATLAAMEAEGLINPLARSDTLIKERRAEVEKERAEVRGGKAHRGGRRG